MNRFAQGLLIAACLASAAPLSVHAQGRELAAFSLALRANDFSLIGRMQRLGLTPQTRDALGNNLLMLAIRDDGPQMALLMLDLPEWRTPEVFAHENQIGENALMIAALKGNIDVATKLINLGAEVNREGWSALHYAATSGNVGMLQLLLERHAYVDAESPSKTTPLMMAARFNHTTAAKVLLSAGADPTLTNEAGFKARDYAVESNNKDLEFVLQLEEIAFENKYINQTFETSPDATLEEIVIKSGGSVVTKPGSRPGGKEVAPGGGAEVFRGIQ